LDYTGIVELKSVQALQKIKAVIENDSLSDPERVDNIIRALEHAGVGVENKRKSG